MGAPAWLKAEESSKSKSDIFRQLLTMPWEFHSETQNFRFNPYNHDYDSDLIRFGLDEKNRWLFDRTYEEHSYVAGGELREGLEFLRKLGTLNWQLDEHKRAFLPLEELQDNPIFSEKDPFDAAVKYGLVSPKERTWILGVGHGQFIEADGVFAERLQRALKEEERERKQPDWVGSYRARRESERNFLSAQFQGDNGFVVNNNQWGQGVSELTVPTEKLMDKEFLERVVSVYGVMTGTDDQGKPVAQIPKELITKISENRSSGRAKTSALDFVKGWMEDAVVGFQKEAEVPDGHFREIRASRLGNINVPLDDNGQVLGEMLRMLGIRPRYISYEKELLEQRDSFTLRFASEFMDRELFNPLSRAGRVAQERLRGDGGAEISR